MTKQLWQMTMRELRDLPAYFDSLYRVETGRETMYPFFTTDTRYAAQYTGEETVRLAVLFKNPLFAKSRKEASEILLGENVYPLEKAKPGRFSPTAKAIVNADERVADAGHSKGHDAIITGSIVQALDLSMLPDPVGVAWDEEEEKYKLEDGSDWTDVSGHQHIVKLALREGKRVPPEVLAEYPRLKGHA
jgi:hypothetical protein